jgi:glyoxylase-like metal-dependent hydrolase (beta-lactamase superfamily II)
MSLEILDREPPAPGSALEIAPGVLWVRMPLPLALDHVNLWILRDEERKRYALLDTGMDTGPTRDAWSTLIAGPLAGEQAVAVIVSHLHPDHIGLAHWLCDRLEVPLRMTLAEYLGACLIQGRSPPADAATLGRFYAKHGASERELASFEGRARFYVRAVPHLPTSLRRIEAGGLLQLGPVWQVGTGAGHSPEHAFFHCPETSVLISGDLLLPSISSNISVFTLEPEGDPLGDFLAALARFRNLSDETLILPSHGRPFRGARARVGELLSHHEERLARLLTALSGSFATASDMVPVLFERNLSDHELAFAFGEALAHLHRLWQAGFLERREDPARIAFGCRRMGPDEIRRSAHLAVGTAAGVVTDQA